MSSGPMSEIGNVGQKRKASGLTQSSSCAEVGQWLSQVLEPEELEGLHFDRVDGPMLMACTNIRLVLDTKDAAVYDKIQAALDELDEPEPSASRPRLSSEAGGAVDMDADGPEGGAAGPSGARVKREAARLAAVKHELGGPSGGGGSGRRGPVEISSDEEDQDGNDENAMAVDGVPPPDVPLVAPHVLAGAAPDGDDGDEVDDEDDEDDEDDDDDKAAVGPAAAAGEADDAPAPAAPRHAPYVPLDPCQPAVVPEDPAAAKLMEQRTLCGLQIFLQFCTTHVLTKINDQFPGTRKKIPNDAQKAAPVVFAQVTKKQSPHDKNQLTVSDRVNRVKKCVHIACSNRAFQKSPGIETIIQRVMVHETAQHDIQKPNADGSGDIVREKGPHLVMRPDTVELLWELWQRSPLLGTFTVPVFTTVSTAGYRGSSWLAPRLYNGTIGARGEAGCSEHDRVKNILLCLSGICNRKNETGSAIRVLSELEREADYDGDNPRPDKMYLLHVALFLEAGMAGGTLKEGLSGFSMYNFIDRDFKEKHGTDLIYLLAELDHMQKDHPAFVKRLKGVAGAHEEMSKRMNFVRVDPVVKLEGIMFPRIMALISDMQQKWPEDLQEKLHPYLKFELRNHQLAALEFVRKEEAAVAGVQRHLWWEMPLPATGNQAGLIPYFSPHFNAIWWATSKDKLMHWDMASNKAHPTCFVRKSHGFRFFERDPPRGGLLALDMGLGKTAIMIAAHAMEGPTEGEAEMVTLHSEDALEESVIVQVGQHEDTKKDRVMYTGFKQLNDRMGSIVPDGSIRVKGRGNLVVTPPTLVAQWESEIHKFSTQPQSVLVLHGIKERRAALTTAEGLRAMGDHDWVITTPGIAKKDIDMLRCIDWHRVIADEAHQLQAHMVGPGMNPNQRAAAYMRMLSSIPANAYWCLTGTPLRNMKQAESLDRIFAFVGAGISTKDHLTNISLATVLGDIAIRYTKGGKLQGEDVLKLPPVTQEERYVKLLDSDALVEAMAKLKLLYQSKIGAETLKQLQAEDAGKAVEEAEEEDEEAEPVGTVAQRKMNALAFRMCGQLIDPVRKLLSGALKLYFPEAGELTAETIIVGEPADLKRPRKKRDEEAMPLAEWRELREERKAKYTELYASSKIDVLVPDVVRLIAEGEAKGEKRKFIIYSNFDAAFEQIKTRLGNEGVLYQTLAGSMSLKRRAEALVSFQEDDETPVFLLTKGCGAMGINLTAASHILIMEPSWNPVWETQAIGRVHRLGQKGPITVTRYVVRDSVEYRLRELMKTINVEANGAEDELTLAVESKAVFSSDEKALNETIAKIFTQAQLAGLIGPIEDDDDDDDDDDDEDDED